MFGRFPVVEHSPGGSEAFDAVLENLAKDKLNAALGWTSFDEHQFISKLTQAGAYNHASDFLMNLEVLSNLPEAKAREAEETGVAGEVGEEDMESAATGEAKARGYDQTKTRATGNDNTSSSTHTDRSSSTDRTASTVPSIPSIPPSRAVHTVAFMMSDGDNLQLLAGDWTSERWYGSPERGEIPLGASVENDERVYSIERMPNRATYYISLAYSYT